MKNKIKLKVELIQERTSHTIEIESEKLKLFLETVRYPHTVDHFINANKNAANETVLALENVEEMNDLIKM